ncbi:MAG: flagellar basal body rod C-terminal domain-containing protein [Pseudomonadota bacterium]
MTFTATFSNALSGLSASTLRAELLSFNIANAQTANFARREIAFVPVTPGGVRATGITRIDAGRAEQQLLSANNNAAGSSVRADALNAINEGFGTPEDPNGLYASFVRFDQALNDLRLTPESGASQTALLRASRDVAETFVQLDTEAQALRLEADRTIGRTVDRINDALVALRDLNAEARRPRGVSIETVAERQRALVLEIADQIDISVDGNFGEALTIRTNGGFQLVGEEAAVLSFTPTGSIASNLTYAAGDLSGIFVNGREITPGLAQGLGDGALAAQFAIRDALVPEYTNRLNAAARDLVERTSVFSTSPALGGLFVLDTGVTGDASRIRVNASVDPAQGGELFRLRDGVGATVPGPEGGDGLLGVLRTAIDAPRAVPAATQNASSYSYLDLLGAVSTGLGTSALRGNGVRDASAQRAETLDTEVNRRVSVDTDRELQDLLLVEQAFAANARVIQVADDMLRQLLEF